MSKPWADTPYDLIETPSHRAGVSSPDPSLHSPDIMSLAHNTYIRAINAMYHQARGVTSPTDIRDFCRYGICFYETIDGHHTNEEKFFFTKVEEELQKPGYMAPNIKQHEAFHDGLENFKSYCETTEKTPESYNPSTYLALHKAMAAPLVQHMHDEITILLSTREMYDPSGAKVSKAWKNFDDEMVKRAAKQVDYPFVATAHDTSFEDGLHDWPPGVGPVLLFVLNWGFARKYAGAWRFGPTDGYFKRRELKFLPKE